MAGDDEALRLGGLLGDFVHGQPDAAIFPVRVIVGIRLHRAIDTYTDAHPVVLAAKAQLPSPYRRYAGILLDMWFDHCLARDFSRWHGLPLEPYSLALRKQLRRNESLLPPALRQFLICMEANDLPAGYAQLGVLEQALIGIGRRLRRVNPLDSALPLLLDRQQQLQDAFEIFYPQLQAFARRWVSEQAG